MQIINKKVLKSVVIFRTPDNYIYIFCNRLN